MPGPPKTPVELTLLRGNPGKRRVNRGRPKPRSAPRKPADLDSEAGKLWDALVRDYAHTGVLTGVDAGVLRIYVEAMVRYRAAESLAAAGPLVRGQKGELVRNPAHQIARDNAELAIRAGRELGFTPAARSALSANGSVAGEEDALSAWERRQSRS